MSEKAKVVAAGECLGVPGAAAVVSMRDWFAGQALAGFIAAHAGNKATPDPEDAAYWAYEYAAAMLEERGGE